MEALDRLGSSKNRTTVRSLKWGARSLALRSLEPVAPRMAVTLAARWFCTPDRGAVAAPAGWDRGARRFDVRVGGERLAAWSWGSAAESPEASRTVLLTHGWNGRAAQLAPIARAIAAAGWRAVSFDHPAHGESTGTVTDLPEMAAAIEAVAEVTGAQAIVAHSLGAVAAVIALAGGLRVERAVFLAAPVDPGRWIDRFVRQVGMAEPSSPRVHDAVAERVGVAPGEIDPVALARDLGGLEARSRAEAGVGTTPAPPAGRGGTPPGIDLLLLHDKGDREVPVTAGIALAAAWPGAHLVCTSGLGHSRILRDASIGRAVAAFLQTGNLVQAVQPLAPAARWDVRDAHLAAAVDAIEV
jgi:hypothetical protein